jgi:hypothetical protein
VLAQQPAEAGDRRRARLGHGTHHRGRIGDRMIEV